MKTYPLILVFVLIFLISHVYAQDGLVGPGKGKVINDQLIGHFIKWNRKATPKIVLRVHGAGILQTFADISSTGEFELPLPTVPPDKNFGSMNCGDPSKGLIVVVSDFSLLTSLPGFTSPGRWDRGFSTIGMASFCDDFFSINIGKPGGKRANWLYSNTTRNVEEGECNNSNSFSLKAGWNSFTIVSGPSGGPHIYNPGLDEDLGWYWSAFPEDIVSKELTKSHKKTSSSEKSVKSISKIAKVDKEWLLGKWNGVQIDTKFKMDVKPSGNVWLESIEGGRKKTMDGKWALIEKEFTLTIKEGVLHFYIEQTSEKSFRLFGKDATSEIVFTRKN